MQSYIILAVIIAVSVYGIIRVIKPIKFVWLIFEQEKAAQAQAKYKRNRIEFFEINFLKSLKKPRLIRCRNKVSTNREEYVGHVAAKSK